MGLEPQLNLNLKHSPDYSRDQNIPAEEGVFIVSGQHGSPTSMTLSKRTPEQLWNLIQKSKDWKDGMKIKLVACRTEGPGNSFAKQLAEISKVNVLASDEYVLVNSLGEIGFTKDHSLDWSKRDTTAKWIDIGPADHLLKDEVPIELP